MDAIILAGGLGTRLQQTVPHVPKPLAPIRGRPFLELLLEKIGHSRAIKRVILAIGYKAEAVEAFIAQYNSPVNVILSKETYPLGTGGAIKRAFQNVQSSDVAVFNGDSYFDIDVDHFIDFHRQSKAYASMACAHVPDTSRYGHVQLEGKRIVRFCEKHASGGPGWINAGLYLLPQDLPFPHEESFSLEKELFPHLLNKEILGYCSHSTFIDIGTQQSYMLAQGVL